MMTCVPTRRQKRRRETQHAVTTQVAAMQPDAPDAGCRHAVKTRLRDSTTSTETAQSRHRLEPQHPAPKNYQNTTTPKAQFQRGFSSFVGGWGGDLVVGALGGHDLVVGDLVHELEALERLLLRDADVCLLYTSDAADDM
eukprot:1162318-Rhodomonas_salina.1